MPKADKDGDDSGEMREVHAIEPAHGVRFKLQVFRMRNWRERGVPEPNRVDAPADQDHDHDGGDLHDAHGLLAGFGDALDVVPPEVDGNENGEAGGAKSWRDVQTQMNVVEGFVEKPN